METDGAEYVTASEMGALVKLPALLLATSR
jgi:hypothetical protein